MRENRKAGHGGDTLGILVLETKGRTERCELLRPRVRLGRTRDNDIRVESGTVSERHARLDHRDGFWLLTDLGSRNGTYLNGRKIDRPVPIRDEDRIGIGDFLLRIEPPPPKRHGTVPMPGRPKVERASLVLVDGTAQRPIVLDAKREITFGTDPSHDVVLDEPMASSTHCLLRVGADGLLLENLSPHGTFVHGLPLGVPHLLREGDVITFGHSGLSARTVRVIVLASEPGESGRLRNDDSSPPTTHARLRDTEPPDMPLALGPGLAPHAEVVREFLREAVLELLGSEGEDAPRWKRLKGPLARCLTRVGERRGYDEATTRQWCLQSDEYGALRAELTELVKRRVGFEPPPT